jgi:glycosyltransferase involved in cell wall biosynthesis
MRLLFISWWWPYPADNGSKIRIYNLLRCLAAVHDVHLLSFAEDGDATSERIAHLETFCAHVEAVPKPLYNPGGMKAMLGYLSRWPRSLVDVYSPAMAERVQALAPCVDVIVASQLQTMRYLELVPTLPAVLEEMEVTSFENAVAQARSSAHRYRTRLTLTKMQSAVKSLMQSGVAVTVVSESERAYLQQFAPPDTRIVVVPNGVDTQVNRPDSQTPMPNTLIYPGAVTYDANFDAVRYFINEVLPQVRQHIPDAQFTVTGSTNGVDVRDLAAQPGVTFAGYLPEVAPAIRASWAVVVPLRQGGGTRLKILEAMALGTPVISTRKGAEGLVVQPGEHILLADEPDTLAQAVVTLLNDPALREHLSQAGRVLVERNYDWRTIADRLNDLIEEVAGKQQEKALA